MRLRLDVWFRAMPFCVASLVATNTWAGQDVTFEGGSLAGEWTYRTVTISGELGVVPHNPDTSEPTGWLHIKAHEIIITESGAINADGSGFAGGATGGAGHLGGEGGTPTIENDVASPGGGGAHFGAGGPGADAQCQLFLNAAGGAAYDADSLSPLALVTPEHGMGSAGGTSNSGAPNNWAGPGGNGGGVVILDAAQITINGPISANGEDGMTTLDGSPGGGAGGSILIHSASLTVGATANLSAAGGEGGPGSTFGGSGGGGLIILWTDADAQALVDAATVDGGSSTSTCAGGTQAGEAGLAILGPSKGCNDADGDGHESTACGGDDCDDGDAEIHTDQPEICDAVDNNCDGTNNEDPDTICPAGQTCVNEQCVEVEVDAGVDAGGLAAGPEIELHGGLCANTMPLGSSSPTTIETVRKAGPMAMFIALLGLVGLARRRSGR